MAYERKPNELGALWVRQSARGEYMTGSLEINGEKIDVICFRVDSQNPKAPTWRVSKSTPRDREAFGPKPESAPPPTDDEIGF